MKYAFLFFILLLLKQTVFAQTEHKYVEVTPQVIATLNIAVEKDIPAFKDKMDRLKLEPFEIAFAIDTFRVEDLTRKRLELSDYQLMTDAYWAEAKLYDGLLNKYYKILMAALKPADKPILVQAQRAWLAYRDSEYKLTELINHIEFDQGTMQGDVNAGIYADEVKKRVNALFANYTVIKTQAQNYDVTSGK